MIARLTQQTNTYDLLDSIGNRVCERSWSKLIQRYILPFVAGMMLFATNVNAQDAETASTVVLSNFMVSEIVNNPETMNVEGYYLELTISAPEDLTSLTFEVALFPQEGEPELQVYPMEVLQKEDGIYLAIQHNHFIIENGNVRINLSIDHESLVDNTVYKITGLDVQGYTISPVEFSHFQ